MPRLRRGPDGPRSSAGGAPGTNKRSPMGGAKSSGNSHHSQLTPRTKGTYGKKRGKKSKKGY